MVKINRPKIEKMGIRSVLGRKAIHYRRFLLLEEAHVRPGPLERYFFT